MGDPRRAPRREGGGVRRGRAGKGRRPRGGGWGERRGERSGRRGAGLEGAGAGEALTQGGLGREG